MSEMRNLLDIINENSQEPEILTEGMLSTLVQKVKAAMPKIPDDAKKKATELVAKALGKDPSQLSMSDVTLANAKKVIAANKQLSEDDLNARFKKSGVEYADVPGSETKNKLSLGAAGAGLGGFMGTIMAVILGDPITGITATAAALGAIILGILFSAGGQPDRAPTGKFNPEIAAKNFSTLDPRLAPKRDPRLDRK